MSQDMIDQLVVIATVAIGFLVAVWFYESLSIRDVYLTRLMHAAHRRTSRRAALVLAYLVCLGIGIPVLVGLWASVLTLALWVVGSVDRSVSASFVAISVIGAARVLSYVREKTAHELAKAIPLAFAFMLLTGGSLNLDQKLELLRSNSGALDITPNMLVLLIGLELFLRLWTDGTHALLATIRGRRGIDDDRGVWLTLWAGIQRPTEPVAAMLGETESTDS